MGTLPGWRSGYKLIFGSDGRGGRKILLPHILNGDPILDGTQIDNMIKKREKKINESNLKLCMITNVMKQNRILPELKAGLEELKSKNKKQPS